MSARADKRASVSFLSPQGQDRGRPSVRDLLVRYAPTLVGLVLIAVQWLPMILAYPRTPGYDGRFFFHQFEIAKVSLLRHGELALWNPFDCRGIAMWDHPESTVASPIVLLTTPLSTHATYWAWNLVHATAGWFGIWLFSSRDAKMSRAAAFVTSAMWTVGAWHVSQSAGNHESFATFYLVPLLFYAWRAAERSSRAVVGTALVVTWIVFQAGTYVVPFTLVLLAVETATRLRSLERIGRVVRATLAVSVLTLLLSASRVLPLADKLFHNVRPMAADTDHILRASTLANVFFFHARDPLGIGAPGQQYGFDEYVIYFGAFGVALAVLGALFAWREHRWTLLVAIVAVMLALGHFAPWSPWSLLQRHVFPFKAMRVASRFLLILAFVMCIWMGVAVDQLCTWVATLSKRPLAHDLTRAGAFALGLFAIVDTMNVGRAIVADRFRDAPPRAVTESERFYYGRPDTPADDLDPDFINQPRQNHAWAACRASSFAFHQDAPIWTGDVAQARAVGDGAIVSDVERTNNTFRLHVEAKERTRIRLNSAYDVGWRSNVGTVVNDDHLLALWVEPGSHDVRLSYWPRTLTAGLALSLCGVLLAATLLVRRDQRSEKR